MIIMRALVATVLLITVVLVSIVLINAHSRQVRSSSKTTTEKTMTRKVAEIIPVFEDFEGIQDDELVEEQSDSRTGVNPDDEWDTLASEENVEGDSYTGAGRGPIPAVVNTKQETGQQKKKTSETRKETKPVTTEDFDGVYEEIPYTEDYTVDQGNYEQEEPSYASGSVLSSYEETVDRSSNHKSGSKSSVKEAAGDASVDSKSVKTSKSRSKESTPSNRKVTVATDRQTPLGYEPESYIVLDEEPSVSKADTDAGINPANTRVSRRALGRKQRAAVGSPETYVLNRSPLIPDLDEDDYREPGCPHRFPLLPESRMTRRLERLRPALARALQQQSIYDPLNWDAKTLNMLRFPQCNACQRKSAALCKTCGRCSDCCGESGCDCGCLNA